MEEKRGWRTAAGNVMLFEKKLVSALTVAGVMFHDRLSGDRPMVVSTRRTSNALARRRLPSASARAWESKPLGRRCEESRARSNESLRRHAKWLRKLDVGTKGLVTHAQERIPALRSLHFAAAPAVFVPM